MTPHLISLYASAAAAIAVLGLFAKQNAKTGWKRKRVTLAQALNEFYMDLGLTGEQETQPVMGEWRPVTKDEAIDFSAQMLKLRSAVGTGAQIAPVAAEAFELVHR